MPKRSKALRPGFGQRDYRDRVEAPGLVSFHMVSQETDLMVRADRPLADQTRELVLSYRSQIEGFIRTHPDFATSLVPWPAGDLAPAIVRQMIQAGSAAGVGPMAAVAGAMAAFVGRGLLAHSRQVVVENGGDLFLKTDGPVVAALYAGHSSLSMQMGIRLAETGDGIGLCTSSGTVGHSLSYGSADAVCVVSSSCSLADAAATAIANQVKGPDQIQAAIAFGQQIDGVLGIVVVCKDQVGAWGAVELVALKGKKA